MQILGTLLMVLIGLMITVKITETIVDTCYEQKETGGSLWQSFLEVIGWNEMKQNVNEMFMEENIKTRVFVDGELYSEGIEVERITPIIAEELKRQGREITLCPLVKGGTDYYFESSEINRIPEFTSKDVYKAAKKEQINHPKHYTQGNIECLDAIKESMTLDGFKGYLKGNIMKYLWRYEHKNGKEDLDKAEFYLKRLQDSME